MKVPTREKREHISFCAFLEVACAILLMLSVSSSLYKMFWDTRNLPDLDLSRCPPLTSNPKRIWAYWHTGLKGMPLFVQQNLKMWKVVSPDWEIRSLQGDDPHDECHISKFVPTEMLPKYFDQMLVQKQSDSARLAVMRLHGGVYMDCTILLFEPLEMNYWHFVDRNLTDPSRKAMVGHYYEWYSLPGRKDGFEIWMIVAKAQEPLIVAWHDLFLKLLEEGPKPFIRNETTGELNPLFKGVNFSKIDQPYIEYGVSTTCLHALLQLNQTWNFTYEYGSIIRNVDDYAYKLDHEFNFDGDKTYDYFYNRKKLSLENIKKMIYGIPLMKLTNHAKYIVDKRYDHWSNLHNNLGMVRVNLLEKGKVWKETGTWDYTFM
jgi:hypothetical protein